MRLGFRSRVVKKYKISPGRAGCRQATTQPSTSAPAGRSGCVLRSQTLASQTTFRRLPQCSLAPPSTFRARAAVSRNSSGRRSEEHTSELQSLRHLVCRLLLEKKKKTHKTYNKIVCILMLGVLVCQT